MEKYTEIFKLAGMLAKAEIPFGWEAFNDGYRLAYYDKYNCCICDVIQNDVSYGTDQNLLEIMGLLTKLEEKHCNGVKGWLTAENVFNRIKKHWRENK